MNDKVQLHVDVPRELWKVMKVEALNNRDTLAGVVLKALEKAFKVKPEPLHTAWEKRDE